MPEKNIFTIFSMDEAESEIRRKLAKVMNQIAINVIEAINNKLDREDAIDKTGFIQIEFIQKEINDDMPIVDLSCNNPNVFYEIVICNSLKQPLVQIIPSSELSLSEFAGTLLIPYDIIDADKLPSEIESDRVITFTFNNNELNSVLRLLNLVWSSSVQLRQDITSIYQTEGRDRMFHFGHFNADLCKFLISVNVFHNIIRNEKQSDNIVNIY